VAMTEYATPAGAENLTQATLRRSSRRAAVAKAVAAIPAILRQKHINEGTALASLSIAKLITHGEHHRAAAEKGTEKLRDADTDRVKACAEIAVAEAKPSAARANRGRGSSQGRGRGRSRAAAADVDGGEFRDFPGDDSSNDRDDGTAGAAAGATGPEEPAVAGEIATEAARGVARKRKRPAAAAAQASGDVLRAPAECEEESEATGHTHSAAQHAVAFLHSSVDGDSAGGEAAGSMAHAPAASKRQRTGLASSDSVPAGAGAAVEETDAATAVLSQPRNPSKRAVTLKSR